MALDRRGDVSPADRAAEALAEKDGVFGAAAEEALLARLDLKIGDTFHFGEATFVLRAVVSQRARPALGRRRLRAAPADLPSSAGRDAAGSAGIAGALDDPGCYGRGRRSARRGRGQSLPRRGRPRLPRGRLGDALAPRRLARLHQDIDRFAEFLTLAGLLSLVVGGVGVANAAQGFVEQKRATLAILKAIGRPARASLGSPSSSSWRSRSPARWSARPWASRSLLRSTRFSSTSFRSRLSPRSTGESSRSASPTAS